MCEPLMTVATPTYNRAHTLPACYQSLCNQTDQRFVWLIIDDGSDDNTETLVQQWIAEKKIRIQYHKKHNGGKASALNMGIGLITTPYAVCLDSDDIFVEKAVENALDELEICEGDKNCCGLLALRHTQRGTVMGGREIPADMKTITAEDVFLKLELRTELICFYKMEVLKQFRFPEFQGEKFVSPAWMQYEITQKYYYATSWGQFCICEYISDGLTRNKANVIKKNPRGYTCVKRFSFNLARKVGQKIKHGIMYDYGCILSSDSQWLRNARWKGWALILMPVAWLVKIKRGHTT